MVQPKPKNPKDIRACLDLRLVNKSMLRAGQVQARITEDFITGFKGCTVFSKLDLNHGYHQFPIDDQSRRIVTFSTPWGNYRYKRLPRPIQRGNRKDYIRYPATVEQPRQHHDRRTQWLGRSQHQPESRSTTDRRSQSNTTKGKMWVRENDDEFPDGHMFTAEGLKPSPDKVRAVQECTPPKTKEELVSFLQMLAYLSRYISKKEEIRSQLRYEYGFIKRTAINRIHC